LSYKFSFNIFHEDQVTEAQRRMKIVQMWEEMTRGNLYRGSSSDLHQNGPRRGRQWEI